MAEDQDLWPDMRAVPADGNRYGRQKKLEAKIRMYQNNIINSGRAVIAFGVWSCVRMFLNLYSDHTQYMEQIIQMLEEDSPDISLDPRIVVYLSYAMIFVVLLADVLLRLYMGRSAVREGHGQKRGVLYLIIAGLYLAVPLCIFISLYFITGSAANVTTETPLNTVETVLDGIANIFIELTSNIALVIMIVSAIQLRRLGAISGKGR